MLQPVKKTLTNLYARYELVTCIYMFEPWEKKLINGFVVLMLTLLICSSCIYLPSYIKTLLQFMSPLVVESPSSHYSPILKTEKLNIR